MNATEDHKMTHLLLVNRKDIYILHEKKCVQFDVFLKVNKQHLALKTIVQCRLGRSRIGAGRPCRSM